MKNPVLRMVVALFCFHLFLGCAATGPQVPIINPLRIDQKEAKEKLMSKYCATVATTDRAGFEGATAICRPIQTGEATFAKVKSSDQGRNLVFMFKERGSADDYSLVSFQFNPLAEVIRSCSPEGLCDVYVRNGITQFGRTNIARYGEPMVNDQGISIKYNEDRFYSYDLLFSYGKGREQDGNELISIFISAFPFLNYQ